MATSLSNCYIPLAPAKKEVIKRRSVNDNEELKDDGSGRSWLSLRQAHFTVSCLSNATGSSLVEIGHTKVVCSVHGPHATPTDAGEFHAEGKLNCLVSMPLCASQSQRLKLSGTESELALNIKDAISSCLLNLESLSKSVIDINLKILQDDGGVLAAAIIASSLALADAGVECLDLVSACHVSAIANPSDPSKIICLIDPTESERETCLGTVTVALMPNMKEVTYWDQSGRLKSEASSEAISLCRAGCLNIYKLMRTCLIESRSTSKKI